MSDYGHTDLFETPGHAAYDNMYLTPDFDTMPSETNLSLFGDGFELSSDINARPTFQAWADKPAWNPSKLGMKQAYQCSNDVHNNMGAYRSPVPSIATTSVSHDNGHEVFTSPSSAYDPQGDSPDPDSDPRRLSLSDSSESDQPQPKRKRRRVTSPKVSPASSASSSSYVASSRRSKKPTLRRNDPSENTWHCEYEFPSDGDEGPRMVCSETFRIESDLKKHMDKHTRPHKCSRRPTCPSGFTTASDLDRHHWAAHDIIPAKGASIWYCPMPDCPGRYAKDSRGLKTWKRKDNFKQHVQRIHTKDDDEVIRIVARSQVHIASSDFVYENGKFVLQRQLGNFQRGTRLEFEPETEPGFEMQQVPQHYYSYPYAPMSSNRSHRASVTSNNRMPPPTHPMYHQVPTNRSNSSAASSYSSGYPSQASSRTSASIGDDVRGRKENIMISDGRHHESLLPRQTLRVPSNRSAQFQARMSALRQTRPHPETPDYTANRQHYANPVEAHHSVHQQSSVQEVPPHWPTPAETPTLHSNYHVADAQIHDRPSTPIKARTAPSKSKGTNTAAKPDHQNAQAPKRQSHVVVDDQVRGVRKQSRKQHMCEHIDDEGKPCNKTFPSKSNLQKHKTRHQKLYGCTHDDCPASKRFGSKNDWKRHEDKQHPGGTKKEWWCNLCARLFEKRKTFADHMQAHHPRYEVRTENHLIDVVRGGGFWCGFCKEITPIDSDTLDAKDDRFNHIGKHFYPAKLDIADWLSPRATRKKKQIDKGRAIIHKAKKNMQKQDDSDDEQPASSDRIHEVDAAAESDNDTESSLEDASGDEEEDYDQGTVPQAPYQPPGTVATAHAHQHQSPDYRQYHDPVITGQRLSLPFRPESPYHPRAPASSTIVKPPQEQAWVTCCRCGIPSAVNGLFDGSCMVFASACSHRYCTACHYS